ncbi:MAG: hypothetical protein IT158_17855 [Bryobacterales bacterium]|nr:hypothetical protein [Bryobacterales bacterium]
MGLVRWCLVLLALTALAGGAVQRRWHEAKLTHIGEIPATTIWTPGSSGSPNRGATDGPVTWEPFTTRPQLTFTLALPGAVHLVKLPKPKAAGGLLDLKPGDRVRCWVEGRRLRHAQQRVGKRHRDEDARVEHDAIVGPHSSSPPSGMPVRS